MYSVKCDLRSETPLDFDLPATILAHFAVLNSFWNIVFENIEYDLTRFDKIFLHFLWFILPVIKQLNHFKLE